MRFPTAVERVIYYWLLPMAVLLWFASLVA